MVCCQIVKQSSQEQNKQYSIYLKDVYNPSNKLSKKDIVLYNKYYIYRQMRGARFRYFFCLYFWEGIYDF